MAESAKCAHPACECRVSSNGPYGRYCSEHCKHAGQITELHCNCQHVECQQHGTQPDPRSAERSPDR